MMQQPDAAWVDADRTIEMFRPSLGHEELAALREVFESGWPGRGPVTERFENRFANHLGVGARRITSVSCCTEGLFQAMPLLGIGAGDEVILPSISFVGAANAVATCGARPVFCDVDRRTLNATADFIDARITTRTKAVILLHYGGMPCEVREIADLLEHRGIHLIEDAACCIASRYDGQFCGTFGDVGVWSFDAMKILTTGDGGMVYCRTEELRERLRRMLYLGLEQVSGRVSDAGDRWWEFEVECPGRRATMNDLTSAIGLVQLDKVDRFVQRRREIHEFYTESLADLSWLTVPPPIPLRARSSYYLYWIQLEDGLRDSLASYLRGHDVYTTFRYYPLHRVGRYGASDHVPNAEYVNESTLCIPLHQELTDDDAARVVETIRAFGARL